MIVVIFGSRPPKKVLYGSRGALMRWYEENRHFVDEAVQQSGFSGTITEVVCGEAPGFDTLGKFWANTHGVPIKSMPAAWRRSDGTTDKSAGFERNRAMGEYAAAGVGLWDGISPGTKHMANIFLMKKKPCYVLRIT